MGSPSDHNYDWVYGHPVRHLPHEARRQLGMLLDGNNTLTSSFRLFAECLGYTPYETEHFLRMIQVETFNHSPLIALLLDYQRRRGVTIGDLQRVLESMNHAAAEVIPRFLPRIAQLILREEMVHPTQHSPPQPTPQQPPREHREPSVCSCGCNSGCYPQPCPEYRPQGPPLYVNPAARHCSIRPNPSPQPHYSAYNGNGMPNYNTSLGPASDNPQHAQHPMPSWTQPSYGPGSPRGPRREMTGEFSDCPYCRAEIDPHQTKLMTTVGQPESKCDSHKVRAGPWHYNNNFSESDSELRMNDNGRERIECLNHFTDSASDLNSVSELSVNASPAENRPLTQRQQSPPRQLYRGTSEEMPCEDYLCRRSDLQFQHNYGERPDKCPDCKKYAKQNFGRKARNSWPDDKRKDSSSQDLLASRASNSSPYGLNHRQIQSWPSNYRPGQFSKAVDMLSRKSSDSTVHSMLSAKPSLEEIDSLSNNFENNFDLSDQVNAAGVSSQGVHRMVPNIAGPPSRSTNCSSSNRFKSAHSKNTKSHMPTNSSTTNVDRTGENTSVPDNEEPSSSMAAGARADSGLVPLQIPSGIRKPIVLVTFSHKRGDGPDHPLEVTELCYQLKRSGVIVKVDMDRQSFRELRMNVQDWLDRWFEQADFVIACITPTYSADVRDPMDNQANPRTSQLNARYIYTKIRHEFYKNQSRNRRCVPVLFSNSGVTRDDTPDWMRNTLIYRYPEGVEEVIKAIIAMMEPDQDGVNNDL